MELEIVAEGRLADPVEDNYDLVLRVDPSKSGRLVGRRIMEDERLLVAPPGMAVDLRLEHQETAGKVSAVGLTATPTDIRWHIKTDDGMRVLSPHFRLRFTSFLMVRDAVLAGAGVALMPKLLVNDDIQAGRLVSWGAEDGPKVEIWALQNSRRLSSSKVRVFLATLASIHHLAPPTQGRVSPAS